MPLHIVLFEPEIPNNTGNIGRLSLASGSHLHLVKPFGFELSDKRVKRAGLDYWQHISLTIYDSIEDFYLKNSDKEFVYFSSHGDKTHWDIDFKEDLFLIFGKESKGLPEEVTTKNADTLYKIPLHSPHIRSLNLANAVSIVVYEGLRQLSL
ncbi:tRNA (cytidine(34)-2'-O)-methyltransferase [Cellulophaga sp. E16_2]|uniref:tRNA (cytidine(34)-2'-O)-methyltransferase n=1 Tax=Cellulophaga sp. E16_2 TaxID=2789297 RepID=UPI001A933F6E|nr:tRNA (cytidine(34)-2'-O)-methyltransferase [Cellulophaga sp. E16_2]MBO0591981.1 tRNA (cytidine(34)-2'-O)-methyltransferase [Cellulophaga sp. E16_2]